MVENEVEKLKYLKKHVSFVHNRMSFIVICLNSDPFDNK